MGDKLILTGCHLGSETHENFSKEIVHLTIEVVFYFGDKKIKKTERKLVNLFQSQRPLKVTIEQEEK